MIYNIGAKDTRMKNPETKQIYLWVPIINAVLNIQIDHEEDIDIDFQPIITDVFVY